MHLCYLSDCEQHRKRRQELSLSTAHYEEATPCPAFPCAQILQFVLTSTETIADLQILADGLVERYEKAGQPPLSCTQTQTAAAHRVPPSSSSCSAGGVICKFVLVFGTSCGDLP